MHLAAHSARGSRRTQYQQMRGIVPRLLIAFSWAAWLTACGGGRSGAETPAIATPSPSPAPTPSPNPTQDTVAPAIAITGPTSAVSFSSATESVILSGTAMDNVGISELSYANSLGGVGTVALVTNWRIDNLSLAAGDNVITVTARDAVGNVSTDTITIRYSGVQDGTPGSGANGVVDSSILLHSKRAAIYAYAGAVAPDDIGGTGAQPQVIADVVQRANACTFGYQVDLPAGTWTLAVMSDADADRPGQNDAMSFIGATTVSVSGSTRVTHDFVPARVLRVGPGQPYATPGAAAQAAQNGEVIEIAAGEYLDDIVVWREDNLTLRGVGGRAHMRATRQIQYTSGNDRENGMGIWVLAGRNTRVENVEFSGASVPDENGAGIRANGPDLTVCNGYFHDNENGILGGEGNVLVEYSEFARNGFGDGQSHNMYISGRTSRFTLRHSYTHHAKIGHNVKTRALENFILYNRIMDEVTGTSSYAVDIPDAGRSYLIGNLIQQGPETDNSTMVAYGAESGSNPAHELYVINNTFVNDRGSGTFLSVLGGTTARIQNNIFEGGGQVLDGPGTLTSNLVSDGPGFINQSAFDYRLTAGSAARDAGTTAGVGGAISLTPVYQYLHPTQREPRPVSGTLDVGAYEYQ